MLTRVVVEERQFDIPLLNNGCTAISFFVRELERTCRVPKSSLHCYVAHPIMEFLTKTTL